MVGFLESHFISHLVLLFFKVNFIFWSLPETDSRTSHTLVKCPATELQPHRPCTLRQSGVAGRITLREEMRGNSQEAEESPSLLMEKED